MAILPNGLYLVCVFPLFSVEFAGVTISYVPFAGLLIHIRCSTDTQDVELCFVQTHISQG